jgi:NADH dehydrogenase/NADH:ubiquinone oxidoreductase subunit G
MEITIDGKKIVLEEPVTALEAARSAGIDSPTLCWHPRVSVLGACRLCMIEVEGINRLLAACTTQVSDGMTISTDTPQLRKVRQAMLELLLCRHPLDCPTCVKGGECELQELAYRHAAPENLFPENPAPYTVADPSPFVERDSEKCVLCRRCVRVCREVRGVTVLAAMERGYHKRVGTYFQQPLNSDFQEPYNCEFCGACIDICPVGALNSKARKFRGRTWEGTATESVCPFCSVGCLLSLQVKEGELVRTVPAEGPNNEDQACFRGRFGTDYVNATSRIITPLLRRDGEQVPVDAGEAVSAAAEKIKHARRAEVIVSSSLTGEELAKAERFAGSVLPGAPLRAVDTLGLEELRNMDSRPWEDLEEADLIVVAGQDFTLFQPVAGVRIRVARGKSGAGLVVLDPRDALLGGEADLWLRPPGEGLALLLTGLVRTLSAAPAGRLKGAAREDLLAALPPGENAEIEKQLGLPSGSIDALAEKVAASEKTVFVGHRGWYDPEGSVAALLRELDRLLIGEDGGRALFLGRDCNSRGSAERAGAAPPREGSPDLLLLVGADPLGNAPPGSALQRELADAEAVIVIDTFATATGQAADVLFPLPHFAEKGGTFTSSSGLRQELGRAMAPPPGVASLGETLDELAGALGKDLASVPATEEKEGEDISPDAPPRIGTLPAPEERCLVLCGVPLADHRIRLVEESVPLFPGPVIEIHPSDLAALGLETGDGVRLTSGEGVLARQVKANLKVPPGRLYLPCDPADGDLGAFVVAAERPAEWPATILRLAGLEKAAGEGKGQ